MKFFCTFLMIFLTASLSSAQKNAVGFFVGGNYSQLVFEHNLGANNKNNYIPGFMVGINASHQFTNSIAVRGELLMEQIGGESCSNFAIVDGSGFGPSSYQQGIAIYNTGELHCVKDKQTYVSLPLLFQISSGEKVKFHFHLGQSVGYLLSRKDDYTYGGSTAGFSKWRYAILAGPGVEVPINGKTAFQINTRFDYGINNIAKEDAMSLNHLVFSGMVGWLHKL